MKTIQAIYENGVFRPTEPVDFPEGSTVTIEARPADPRFAHLPAGLAKVYATLSRRYDDGPADGAARHDEHQP